ncbi:MAG TPA: NAD(P)-dependent alcohol dehydrogenase, partial [Nitrososphaerales archaeon]|nr:NAD(P)-dependent alcohol dehydrogenase [Nitrososphaerales archaeon]
MKALVYSRYGLPEVLHLKEVSRPVPKEDEVLVKVRAVSLNRSDWERLRGTPWFVRFGGFFRPRHHILGSDVAGRVEAVGRNVERIRPGDEVFGDLMERAGGLAEYVCVRERLLAVKPGSLTFEEAATMPQAGVIALQGIRDKGRVKQGQRVLINGAGGCTGVFAVQLAKSFGAEVTGVDNSGKLEFMRSLGADHVVDYSQEDFTKSGHQYDLILDVVGNRSVFDYNKALSPGGLYLAVGGSLFTLLQILFLGALIGRRTGRRMRILVVRPKL